MTDVPPSSPHPAQPTGPETIFVDSHRVSCDGGGGALGHPLVYYSLDDGEAICGY
ncbi:MAG: zinc-finger domain-containing protein, partial [Pseudomonadota bacterium]